MSQRPKTHHFFDRNMVVVKKVNLKKEHECPAAGSTVNIVKLHKGG